MRQFIPRHFLKNIRQDLKEKMELRFLRDTDKREVDFAVLKNKKPLFAVECKSGDGSPSPHIKYFRERTNIPQFYQIHLKTKESSPFPNVAIMPFQKFAKIKKI